VDDLRDRYARPVAAFGVQDRATTGQTTGLQRLLAERLVRAEVADAAR